MTITEFLEARIAEDERQAKICLELGWVPAAKYEITSVGPTRTLAECAAKRAIIAKTDDALDSYAGTRIMDHVLESLAAVYSDHPDYPL